MRYTLYTQRFFCFLNSLAVCQFVWGPGWQLYGPGQTVEMIRAVTGWDMTIEECMLVGERSLNLLRSFNAREGFTSEDDSLPTRMLTEPLRGGATDGIVISESELSQAKDWYYAMCGWDSMGKPSSSKLQELEIVWAGE